MLISMELSQLRTLVTVAGTLNFTRAARRLALTQSAISHQMKSLEDELGEPLFLRVGRGVVLSEAGKVAVQHAERILGEIDSLRDQLGGPGRPLAGRVRAAAATQAFVYLFAELFEGFMETHPNVEVSFRTTVSTDQTVAEILGGSADVGLAALPVFSPALQVNELYEDELFLILSPRHPLARKKSVTVNDLHRERWILFERGTSIRRTTDEFMQEARLPTELALESNDTYFVKRMIEKGRGVSLMPLWTVREEVDAGRLARAGIDGHRLRRQVSLVSLRRNPGSATRAFVEFLLTHRKELQALARGETTAVRVKGA